MSSQGHPLERIVSYDDLHGATYDNRHLGNPNKKSCVDCHEHVGHKNLGLQIDKFEAIKKQENNKTK